MPQHQHEQIEFSSVLFDTLFGLIIFFSLDSFLEIREPFHFVFYLFTAIIVVHWWLIFKSADDMFDEEVYNSSADLVLGILYIIILEYVILLSKEFNYYAVIWFLVALLTLDIVWAAIWRYLGEWDTKDRNKQKTMERELDSLIKIDVFALVLFIPVGLVANTLTPASFVSVFIIAYLIYIFLTFKYKIIDLKIF